MLYRQQHAVLQVKADLQNIMRFRVVIALASNITGLRDNLWDAAKDLKITRSTLPHFVYGPFCER